MNSALLGKHSCCDQKVFPALLLSRQNHLFETQLQSPLPAKTFATCHKCSQENWQLFWSILKSFTSNLQGSSSGRYLLSSANSKVPDNQTESGFSVLQQQKTATVLGRLQFCTHSCI
ncbi:hypothetical protein ILYODFUR_012454 [Ilyodon furcidens]|uniref:Uncharacterized protein n=1 Tax=Ilyodon furcidens TaxID=33524 RepID=A0ABV0TB78_9TELE